MNCLSRKMTMDAARPSWNDERHAPAVGGRAVLDREDHQAAQEGKDQVDDHARDHEEQRVPPRLPEHRILKEREIVVEPDELVDTHAVAEAARPAEQRFYNRQRHRIQGKDRQQHERGQDHQIGRAFLQDVIGCFAVHSFPRRAVLQAFGRSVKIPIRCPPPAET